MVPNELLSELQKLNRADKLRVVQFLVDALAVEEETLLASGMQYEVWSPYDAPCAAQTLLAMLDYEVRRHPAMGARCRGPRHEPDAVYEGRARAAPLLA